MKKYVKDFLIVLIILVICLVVWLYLKFENSKQNEIVCIYQNGKKTAEYSLNENLTLSIPWEEGGYNLVLICDRKVSVSDADCPDELCVHQREISHNGESIICLPHKLVVQVESKEESELDSVTY